MENEPLLLALTETMLLPSRLIAIDWDAPKPSPVTVTWSPTEPLEEDKFALAVTVKDLLGAPPASIVAFPPGVRGTVKVNGGLMEPAWSTLAVPTLVLLKVTVNGPGPNPVPETVTDVLLGVPLEGLTVIAEGWLVAPTGFAHWAPNPARDTAKIKLTKTRCTDLYL